MKKKTISLILWILIFQLIGFFIGQITKANSTPWFQTLNKSTLTPPDIVFAIVWSLLYIMLALAGWSLWQQHKKKGAKPPLFFYGIQVIMNWSWTFIFFKFHLVALGFYWIIGIIFFTLITIILSWHKFKFAAHLLLPYLCWLVFASYLNWAIWVMN